MVPDSDEEKKGESEGAFKLEHAKPKIRMDNSQARSKPATAISGWLTSM
jgi:hypothetical protein